MCSKVIFLLYPLIDQKLFSNFIEVCIKDTHIWVILPCGNQVLYQSLQGTSYEVAILECKCLKKVNNQMSHLMTKPTKWPLCPVKTHPPSLIRVFVGHSLGSQGPNTSSCGQRRLWSDLADAQADLSLRWKHMPYCWFCHDVAQISAERGCSINLLGFHTINFGILMQTKQLNFWAGLNDQYCTKCTYFCQYQ